MTRLGKRLTPKHLAGHSGKSAPRKKRRFEMHELANKGFWQDSAILVVSKLYNRRVLYKPYIEGNRWLSQWCSRPLVAHGIYQGKYELFCQMIANLDGCKVDPAEAFQANLYGNFLLSIKHDFQWAFSIGILDKLRESKYPYWSSLLKLIEDSPLGELDKYFSVSGLEYLERAYRKSRGVILLSYHGTTVSLAVAALHRRLGSEPIQTISQHVALKQSPYWQNSLAENISLAATSRLNAGVALQGQRLLSQGKIIQMINENVYGRGLGNYPVIVAGRKYFLKSGFAELALNTGAAIVVQFTTNLADGRIHTTFLPPLVPEPGNWDFQVENLLKQYADFLTSSWKSAPESLRWKRIQTHFNQPVAPGTQSVPTN